MSARPTRMHSLLAGFCICTCACTCGCSVDSLVSSGRPCSAQAPCGPDTTCDPVTRTCTSGGGCPAGQTRCGETCVDLASSAAHCGQCDHSCQENSDRCKNGTCVCGSSGAPCAEGLDCIDGRCRCVVGGSCDGCCANDTCVLVGTGQSSGRCGGGGEPCQSCDDGIDCTQDTCVLGFCDNPLAPDTCLIQGTCHPEGTIEPSNHCRRCESQTAPFAWSGFLGKGCVLTVAGSGSGAHIDGPALSAGFSSITDVAVEPSGAFYVTDTFDQVIRKIAGGQVTTLAGILNAPGYADGPVKAAMFSYPSGIAVDSAGVVYVVGDNYVVRKIASGQVTTLAGTGSEGFKDGPSATAQFSHLTDVEVDAAGTVYVADQGNCRIRTISNGQVATLAGSGIPGHQDGPAASAQFFSIWGLAVTPSGDAVYVTEDSQWHTIRKIAAGTVSTIAGGTTDGYLDGPVATALFNAPSDVVVDGQGILYVTDNKNVRIRKIAGGTVTTVAGSGKEGFWDGSAGQAQFDSPTGLALYGNNIYIADTSNHRVRAFQP